MYFLPEFMWLSCGHAGAQEEGKIDQCGAESLAGGGGGVLMRVARYLETRWGRSLRV